jgi:hypothetical protein
MASQNTGLPSGGMREITLRPARFTLNIAVGVPHRTIEESPFNMHMRGMTTRILGQLSPLRDKILLTCIVSLYLKDLARRY